jgi:hypothetical protein
MNKETYKTMMHRLEFATNGELLAFRSRCADEMRSPLAAVDPDYRRSGKLLLKKINEEIETRHDIAVIEIRRERIKREAVVVDLKTSRKAL